MKQPKTLTQNIRRIMNLIAPDTFEKKEQEIKSLMFKTKEQEEESKEGETSLAINDENLHEIVATVFRKAQAEKDYCNMYADLCQNLTQEELIHMGCEKVTKQNIAKSNFRKALLMSCRESFDKLFMTEQEFLALEEEQQLKTKDKLMNNIKFVGQLFKAKLVSEKIIGSIFDQLMNGKDDNKELVTTRTVEGAITLVTKVGPELDDQINVYQKQIEKAEVMKKESGADVKKLEDGRLQKESQQKALISIYDMFTVFENDPSFDNRIRLLIKNMFQNRAEHWKKSKEEEDKGPMKIEELKAKIRAKA
jgi:hypothetical protein